MITANYFDGKSGLGRAVNLVLAHGSLHLTGAKLDRHVHLRHIQLSETFAHAPYVLNFDDGARCEVHAAQDKKALLAMLQYQPSLVQKLQRRWQGALAAVVLMVAMFALLRSLGVPWLAEQISHEVPLAVEQKLGQQSVKALEQNLFKPSTASLAQQAQAEQVLQSVLPRNLRMPVQLKMRHADSVGPNAFALPDGSIVLTDAMLKYLSDGNSELNPVQREYLAAIFAHELGHLQQRHSLKNIIASSLFGAVSWSLLGDFSSVAAGAPVLLLQMEYSRDMETEADDYAWNLLKEKGIAPQRITELFAHMEKTQSRKMSSQVPQWMRNSADYLSTHPAYAERIAHLQQKMAVKN